MNKEAHHAMVVTALAEYYNRTISATVLGMYVEDLMVLSPEELQHAAKLYRCDGSNKFFPIPAVLIELARPRQSAQDAARDAATLILDCLARDGYTNPDRAKARMGDLAWKVVERMGGWTRLCQEVSNQNLTMYAAQVRELAAVVARKAERGEIDTPPSLPENKTVAIKAMNAVMEKATLKQIPRGDSE